MSKKILLLYSAAILLGAFLMFLIQPLVGKIVTPQYGGGSQVWCVCLLFFQLTLLGGYGLTWVLSHLKPRAQAITYMVLMGVSLFLVHIPLGSGWAPDTQDNPTMSLLGQLLLYLAVPAILLSTVSTTIQNWYRLAARENPYKLYSISNIGSMSALLAYPVLLEPNLSLSLSVQVWTWGYWGLVGAAIISALFLLKAMKEKPEGVEPDPALAAEDESIADDVERRMPIPRDFAWWIFLAALGTSLLISFTTHITHNIAPVPLLWILPLALYLLTFIIAFAKDAYYHRTLFLVLAQVLLFVDFSLNFPSPWLMVTLNLLTLFALCMVCHGEIYASRPASRALPIFYLSIAFGGALGGILVNLAAPVVFNTFIEFPLLLLLMAMLTLVLMLRREIRLFYNPVVDKVYLLALAGYFLWSGSNAIAPDAEVNVALAERNFYGSAEVLVERGEGERPGRMILMNGTIRHGTQLFDEQERRFLQTPTAYFSRNSGMGVAHRLMREHKNGEAIKMGIIGLGVGTIAAYGEPGDKITFYEIDPKVKEIAESDYFAFLRDARADVDIVMGDARLKLQEQEPQQYDILVLDAFSSDAIPVHLLTREAFELYLSHLNPEGLLVVHISNQYLDLKRVTGTMAHLMNMEGVHVLSKRLDLLSNPSIYTVMTRDGWFKNAFTALDFPKEYPDMEYRIAKPVPDMPIWTDDYSNLWSVVHFDPSREWAETQETAASAGKTTPAAAPE